MDPYLKPRGEYQPRTPAPARLDWRVALFLGAVALGWGLLLVQLP